MPKAKPVPQFEGAMPDHVTYTAGGSITNVDDQPDGSPTIGDWLSLECTAQVVGVNHTINNDGEVTRSVKVKMDTMRTLEMRPSDDADEEFEDDMD